jgi:thiol-disulfide isomerase/thioredoxin
MKRRMIATVGLVMLGLVGLVWLAQVFSGLSVPVQILDNDPRPPGEVSVRLQLETGGESLPVLLERYLFTDQNDGSRRDDRFRTLDLGEMTAFWQYHQVIPNRSAATERVVIPSRTEPIADRPGWSRLVLSFEPYGSELVAEFQGHELQPLSTLLAEGIWRKPRGESTAEVPFRSETATSGTPLFDPTLSSRPPADFGGRWRVRFGDSDEPAVGSFQVGRHAGDAFGTFLTTTGDYRYLAGRVDGDLMRLSTFDGAHAFLFHARMRDDGTIAGEFWSGNWHHETWTAVRDDDARLPDAFGQTTATGVGVEELAFRDLDGTPTRVAELLDAGGAPARVLYLFGSWCPNCADAGAEMKRLKDKYGDKLTMVGLAFELTEDFERSARQVGLYLERHGADWPVLIGGLSDKAKASAELPVLDRVRAYPTTIFLDNQNQIVAVHTGFSGPATGTEYEKQKKAFEGVVEGLMGP